MHRLRNAALVFAALALLFAGSAQAAPAAYSDDAGDSLDTRPSMDIVGVSYDVRQVNKSGPPSLVVEMELAGPPEGQLASYETRAQVEGCGYFQTSYAPGTLFVSALGSSPASFFMECGSAPDSTGSTATLLDAQFRIDGNKLRWAIAMDSIPKELRGGTTFSELNAFTQIAEPVSGIFGTGSDLPLPMDEAATDKTWSY
ncbi:MAG TPA: hypothetical protein VMY88_11410 [Acidimicrobiales bacterium]|nr:hypothetical protein [Acidimicrobiales bacterium]